MRYVPEVGDKVIVCSEKNDDILPDREAVGPEICFFSEFDVVST
jgi:hypothetical protein